MLEQVILFIIYGFVFVLMGLTAFLYRDDSMKFLPLAQSLHHLGFFGVLHGLAEWNTMLIMLDFFGADSDLVFHINQGVKILSFLGLWRFGATMLPKTWKPYSLINKIPFLIVALWILGRIYFYQEGLLEEAIKFDAFFMRYLMVFPGALISAFALYLRGKERKEKYPHIGKKYYQFALTLLLYGFFDGICVPQMSFFPANVINNNIFTKLFGIPPQITKILVGLLISYYLMNLLNTFREERSIRLKSIQRKRAADAERRKIGIEIHDSVIQQIYAINLRVEYLSQLAKKNKDENYQKGLAEVSKELSQTTKRMRKFIVSHEPESGFTQDLIQDIEQLLFIFNEYQEPHIHFIAQISEDAPLEFPYKVFTVYYIVQEAVRNLIQHAHASSASMKMEMNRDALRLDIVDNGIGIPDNIEKEEGHIGIEAMKKRAGEIGADLEIIGNKKGSKVSLQVPLGGYSE